MLDFTGKIVLITGGTSGTSLLVNGGLTAR